jgi:hypothetical protein
MSAFACEFNCTLGEHPSDRQYHIVNRTNVRAVQYGDFLKCSDRWPHEQHTGICDALRTRRGYPTIRYRVE